VCEICYPTHLAVCFHTSGKALGRSSAALVRKASQGSMPTDGSSNSLRAGSQNSLNINPTALPATPSAPSTLAAAVRMRMEHHSKVRGGGGGGVDGRMDGWMDGWMDGVLSSPPWRPPHLTSRRLASRHAACDTFPLTQQATVEARRREIALKRYARRERDLTAMLHLLNKSEHVRVDGKEAGAVTCG